MMPCSMQEPDGTPESLAQNVAPMAFQGTVAERLAAGRALRQRVPRKSHGEWRPAPARPDPVAILAEQAETRHPDYVPVRHGRMLSSPFAFLRGSAAVMTADLAPTPRSDISVQACGDCHLSNFGVFATPERALIFGINDFDETYPGPWEWDVKRLAASFVVAARFGGLREADGREVAHQAVSAYQEFMAELAPMPYLTLWYERITAKDVLQMLSPAVRKRGQAMLAKARGRTHGQTLEKMTKRSQGVVQIAEARPLIVRETATRDGIPMAEALQLWLQAYRTSGKSPRQTGAVFAVRRTRRRSHVANALEYHAMLPCRSLPQGH